MLLPRPVPTLTHVVDSAPLGESSSPPMWTATSAETEIGKFLFASDINRLAPRPIAVVSHVQHDTASRVGRAARAHLWKLSPPMPRMYTL